MGTSEENLKLFLVRHAKTEPTSASGRDFDRKLLPKGIIQANVLGHYLDQMEYKPSLTFCSDAIRTRETLSIIRNIVPVGKVFYRKDLYLSDRETYLSVIWEQDHADPILFIGHNDGISALASYLTDTDIHLKTGGYVCITFSADNWKEVSRGTGRIMDGFRPSVHFPD